MLSLIDHKSLLRNGVLIGVDFIVSNEKDEILIGKRNNAPAKGFYFIPGGRIFKDETLKKAVERISEKELGVTLTEADIKLHGIYEHLYPVENVYEELGYGTHYVILAVKVNKPVALSFEVNDQHHHFQFLAVDKILKNERVHHYTKCYFQDNANNKFL